MNQVLPDANVTGYQQHLSAVSLRDQDDRHVVAAAIEARAALILTWNIQDFRPSELARHGLATEDPDMFAVKLYEQIPDLVIASTGNARHNLTKSRISAADFLLALDRQRLHTFSRIMTGHVSSI
jgi:hypothetical protein